MVNGVGEKLTFGISFIEIIKIMKRLLESIFLIVIQVCS